VTGAGDTVIGTFSLALASGLDLKSAAVLSNYAAGIVVGEVGTSTVSAEELKKLIANSQSGAKRQP
jgi:bifunctional ADP-heptose synthase (sugar kinase/adenylyltransferase)